MKEKPKRVKSSKKTIKLSTRVRAGAYVGLGLNVGGGRGKSGV